jgi:hypothetical protein
MKKIFNYNVLASILTCKDKHKHYLTQNELTINNLEMFGKDNRFNSKLEQPDFTTQNFEIQERDVYL